MKQECSMQTFEKFSNINFHENPSSGRPEVPCGWTGRHDEVNSSFPNFANAPKKCVDTQVISKPKLQEGAILALSCGHLLIQHCSRHGCSFHPPPADAS